MGGGGDVSGRRSGYRAERQCRRPMENTRRVGQTCGRLEHDGVDGCGHTHTHTHTHIEIIFIYRYTVFHEELSSRRCVPIRAREDDDDDGVVRYYGQSRKPIDPTIDLSCARERYGLCYIIIIYTHTHTLAHVYNTR